jgi:hypothetical protein
MWRATSSWRVFHYLAPSKFQITVSAGISSMHMMLRRWVQTESSSSGSSSQSSICVEAIVRFGT